MAIRGTVERGETFFDVFKRNKLKMGSLFAMREAAASVHRLKDLNPGQPYTITVDDDQCVDSLVYWIDDDFLIKIELKENGYQAKRCKISYEPRILNLTGSIENNLVSSIGENREHLLLALKISDIFEWDIDFTSDLRQEDTYAVVVEGLYLNGVFKKYGNVLAAEFVNNGEKHVAYRYEWDGKADYFDAEGKSLKKAFLKAPLSFRRISSFFSRKRFHPILKIYRPHHGVDYAAAKGTPVSVTGDGTVHFSGRRGQYGKLVVVNHQRGYTTYYGHLSRIARGIRPGVRVRQGDLIGYVGQTGLATGPHLHYEVRNNGTYVNPLVLKATRGGAVPPHLIAEFKRVSAKLQHMLASSTPAYNTHLSDKDNGSMTDRCL